MGSRKGEKYRGAKTGRKAYGKKRPGKRRRLREKAGKKKGGKRDKAEGGQGKRGSKRRRAVKNAKDGRPEKWENGKTAKEKVKNAEKKKIFMV